MRLSVFLQKSMASLFFGFRCFSAFAAFRCFSSFRLSFVRLREKDPPVNLMRPTPRYLASPGAAQRRHLAKAEWLSNLAKAKLLRTENRFTSAEDLTRPGPLARRIYHTLYRMDPQSTHSKNRVCFAKYTKKVEHRGAIRIYSPPNSRSTAPLRRPLCYF